MREREGERRGLMEKKEGRDGGWGLATLSKLLPLSPSLSSGGWLAAHTRRQIFSTPVRPLACPTVLP
jgi:hypothetical protein